jgi:hypothetical protein
MIKNANIRVTTTGSPGSASGEYVTGLIVKGSIVAVMVKYHASAPATTDVVVTENEALIPHNIVSLIDNNTDTTVYPVAQNTNNAGSAVAGEYIPYPVCHHLKVSVSESDALTDCVEVEVLWEE